MGSGCDCCHTSTEKAVGFALTAYTPSLWRGRQPCIGLDQAGCASSEGLNSSVCMCGPRRGPDESLIQTWAFREKFIIARQASHRGQQPFVLSASPGHLVNLRDAQFATSMVDFYCWLLGIIPGAYAVALSHEVCRCVAF
jgi:hypothetical protein